MFAGVFAPHFSILPQIHRSLAPGVLEHNSSRSRAQLLPAIKVNAPMMRGFGQLKLVAIMPNLRSSALQRAR